MPGKCPPRRCQICNVAILKHLCRKPKFCSRACRRAATPGASDQACAACGKLFRVYGYRSQRRCCSTECRATLPLWFTTPKKRRIWKKKTCPICKEQWQPRKGQDKQVFCSQRCMGERNKTGKTLLCITCKKRIWVAPRRTSEYKAQFCSKACANIWQRRNRKFFNCEYCGKRFWLTKSVAESRLYIRYCSRKCCHTDPAHKERVFESLRLKVQTKLETVGYALLDSEGVVYQPQCTVFGKWCVDAFVPSAKLIIQFDGDYWHGNPARFPTLTPRQDRQRRMDCGQDNYVQKRGYHTLRIWERDMYKRPDEVRARLRAALTG